MSDGHGEADTDGDHLAETAAVTFQDCLNEPDDLIEDLVRMSIRSGIMPVGISVRGYLAVLAIAEGGETT